MTPKDNKEEGKIILVCGLPGSGKSTLIKNAIKSFPEKIEYMKSYTTRGKRDGEDDSEYYFVNHNQYEIAKNEATVWEESVKYNNYYGEDVTFYRQRMKIGKFIIGCCHPSIEDLAPLFEYYSKDQIFSIFLDTPKDISEKRLIENRGIEGMARLAIDMFWKPTEKFTENINKTFIPTNNLDEDTVNFNFLVKSIIDERPVRLI